MNAVTASQMRQIDLKAQNYFLIPGIILMENAGRAVASFFLSKVDRKKIKRVAVFCGKGNNGGDGFVAARYLHNYGFSVKAFLLADRKMVRKGPARQNLEILLKFGIGVVEINEANMAQKIRRPFRFDAVIDAIYGTGFSGDMPQLQARVVEFLNTNAKNIFSVDVPSGLDATTGRVADFCIRADYVVTFGCMKKGLLKKKGHPAAKAVALKDIGFPLRLVRRYLGKVPDSYFIDG